MTTDVVKDKKVDEFHQSHKDAAKKAAASLPSKVKVHPLVLLSITDHYERLAKDTEKRVCGVLLGKNTFDGVEVTSSYAVPFEEDLRNPKVWFFDHNYHEDMYNLVRKVNTNEKVVGWYSTGPLIRSNDLALHEVLRAYCTQPIFLIADVTRASGNEQYSVDQHSSSKSSGSGSLIRVFCSIPSIPEITHQEESKMDENDEFDTDMMDTADASASTPKVNTKPTTMDSEHVVSTNAFTGIPAEIETSEAEEVGVEHLLRDETAHSSTGTLKEVIFNQASGLKSLVERLREIETYLTNVANKVIPPNARVLSAAQEILSLCPDVASPSFIRAVGEKINDSLVAVYVASLVRSVTSLHSLVENRHINRAAERSVAERAALIEAMKQNVADEATGGADVDDVDIDSMNF